MSNKTDNAGPMSNYTPDPWRWLDIPDVAPKPGNHTPGPWKIQADPTVTQHQRENWAAHNFRHITTNHPFNEEGSFDDRDGKIICTTTDAEEQEANARLIAAAPCLLLALERLARGSGHVYYSDDLEFARATIARAKGGQ